MAARPCGFKSHLPHFLRFVSRFSDMRDADIYAEVAELADAHGSGPCGGNTLWVQVPSSAVLLEGASYQRDMVHFSLYHRAIEL